MWANNAFVLRSRLLIGAVLHPLSEALLGGLHVLHFGKHDVGGVSQLVRRLLEPLCALLEIWVFPYLYIGEC